METIQEVNGQKSKQPVRYAYTRESTLEVLKYELPIAESLAPGSLSLLDFTSRAAQQKAHQNSETTIFAQGRSGFSG
jgi:hypothetical protein